MHLFIVSFNGTFNFLLFAAQVVVSESSLGRNFNATRQIKDLHGLFQGFSWKIDNFCFFPHWHERVFYELSKDA